MARTRPTPPSPGPDGPRKGPPALPPRLAQVLAPDGPPFGRPKLKADEMRALAGVLAEGAPANQRLHLGRAMAIAADRAPTADTARLIGRILRDDTADLALRRRAAMLLGDIGLRAAAKLLAEALPAASPSLEPAILAALARNGDASALPAIEARPPTPSRRLAQLREFTRALVLVRLGRSDARAMRALAPAGRDVPIAALDAKDAKAVVAGVRGSTFGVAPDVERALGWRCGPRHVLLPAADLPRRQLFEHLRAAPRLAAVVMMEDAADSPTWVARRLVFTRPDGDAVQVVVTTSRGETELLGRLTPDGSEYRLRLQGADGARRPLEVNGRMQEDGRLELAAWLVSERGDKRPGDVDPAAG